MKCPKCGVNLGKMKDKLIVVVGKKETFDPRDNVYASVVEYYEYEITSDKKAVLVSKTYICPICGMRFKPKEVSQ